MESLRFDPPLCIFQILNKGGVKHPPLDPTSADVLQSPIFQRAAGAKKYAFVLFLEVKSLFYKANFQNFRACGALIFSVFTLIEGAMAIRKSKMHCK